MSTPAMLLAKAHLQPKPEPEPATESPPPSPPPVRAKSPSPKALGFEIGTPVGGGGVAGEEAKLGAEEGYEEGEEAVGFGAVKARKRRTAVIDIPKVEGEGGEEGGEGAGIGGGLFE